MIERIAIAFAAIGGAAALWMEGMSLPAAALSGGLVWAVLSRRRALSEAARAAGAGIGRGAGWARRTMQEKRAQALTRAARLREALEEDGGSVGGRLIGNGAALVLAAAAFIGEVAPQASALAPLFGDTVQVPGWLQRLGLLLSFLTAAASIFWGHETLSSLRTISAQGAGTRQRQLQEYVILLVGVVAFGATLYIQVAAVDLRTGATNLRLDGTALETGLATAAGLARLRGRVMLLVTLLAIVTALAGLRYLGGFAAAVRCLAVGGMAGAYGAATGFFLVLESTLGLSRARRSIAGEGQPLTPADSVDEGNNGPDRCQTGYRGWTDRAAG